MEALKVDQIKEQSTLGEILTLLNTLMTTYSTITYPNPVKMTDSTVQTSPSLVAQASIVSERSFYKDMVLCNRAVTHPKEKVGQSIFNIKKRSPKKQLTSAFIQAVSTLPVEKQQLAFSHMGNGRPEHTESCDTRSVTSSVATTTSSPFIQDPKMYYVVGPPVQIEPFKLLNDTNENDSTTWIEMPRQKPKSKECQSSRRKKRALILPTRCNRRMSLDNVFEKGQYVEDQENKEPQSAVSAYCKKHKSVSSCQQQSTSGWENKVERGPALNPWSWSQSSNSSQVIMEYQQAQWEPENCDPKENTIKKQRGGWQLFDFISDSD